MGSQSERVSSRPGWGSGIQTRLALCCGCISRGGRGFSFPPSGGALEAALTPHIPLQLGHVNRTPPTQQRACGELWETQHPVAWAGGTPPTVAHCLWELYKLCKGDEGCCCALFWGILQFLYYNVPCHAVGRGGTAPGSPHPCSMAQRTQMGLQRGWGRCSEQPGVGALLHKALSQVCTTKLALLREAMNLSESLGHSSS